MGQAELLQENITLKQQNEVLHSCWCDAQSRASSSANRCMNLLADISKKDARIAELEQLCREFGVIAA